MGRDTDFNFGWNEADNLAPPWSNTSSISKRASAGTGRRTAQQASAVPASEDWQDNETCEYVVKQIRLMTATVRKANRMGIPKPTASSKSNGRAPAPEQAGGGDFAPWLKVNELIKTKVLKIGQKFKMQVIEAREAGGNNFSDVIVDVKIGKNLYAWGLKADKKAYAALYDQFGDRLDRWKGTVSCLLAEPYKKGYNPSIEVL